MVALDGGLAGVSIDMLMEEEGWLLSSGSRTRSSSSLSDWVGALNRSVITRPSSPVYCVRGGFGAAAILTGIAGAADPPAGLGWRADVVPVPEDACLCCPPLV